jgi:hypothetical protein
MTIAPGRVRWESRWCLQIPLTETISSGLKAPHHDSHIPEGTFPGGTFKRTKISGRDCDEWSILYTLQKLKTLAGKHQNLSRPTSNARFENGVTSARIWQEVWPLMKKRSKS